MLVFFESLVDPLMTLTDGIAHTMSANLGLYATQLIATGTTISTLHYGFMVVRGENNDPLLPYVWKIMKTLFVLAVIQSYASLDIVGLVLALQQDLLGAMTGSPDVGAVIDNQTGPMIAFFAGLVIMAMSSFTGESSAGVISALLIFCFVVLGGGVLALALFYALLAHVGLDIALGLGPLFIAALAYGPTARFFDNWLSSIVNFCILLGVSTVTLVVVNTVQANAWSSAVVLSSNFFVTVILLIMVGLVLLLFMMEVPRFVSQLTGGADVTGAVSGVAYSKVVYGQLLGAGQNGKGMAGAAQATRAR